ncbi:GNAT family N-acetyltransferase [Streptomyces sp. NPDC015492]|uniref:GNAT family N-acetyltransferase n=1 Tax=Streptomyces sp. NPDC015492 TaxID=3364958 RepID=UPI0036F6C86D
MKKPAEVFGFEDFALRRWRTDDGPAVARAIDESREHLLPWSPLTRDDSSIIGERLTRRALDGWISDETYSYAITVDNAIAGGCSLMRVAGGGGLEIGYWLHSSWTGRGLATRSASALVDAGLLLDGISWIDIRHDAANTASAGIPRRLGFVELERVPVSEAEHRRTPGECGIAITWRRTKESRASAP